MVLGENMQREDLLKILEDLLLLDDIKAVMVAKQGLDGIVPENNKLKDIDLWRTIRDATDDIFPLIDKFYSYQLDRFYFELGEYTIVIVPISRTFALLVVFESLANSGLLDVEIENSRRKILELANLGKG